MPLITRSDDERLGVLDTVSGSPPPIAILYRDSLRAALEELRTIDEVLARRPALAEQNNRVNKILHAIVVAKNCDAALVRATVAEAEVARLNKVIAEMTRLRAALAARDTLAGQVEEKDKRIETLTRWNNNAARLRDEAEAQLCGVKEIMSNVAFPCAACEQVIDALSSSAPCPHEEEAKRWKEYAEHQEHCATCGEAVSDCAEGSELRRRAGRKP